MAASILQINISQNPICDNLVGFPKSGHIYYKQRKIGGTTSLANLPINLFGGRKSGEFIQNYKYVWILD